MKSRWLVMLALAAASGAASADWTLVGSTDGRGGVDHYFDRATISKSGNTVTQWVLEDHKVAQSFAGKTFLSAKFQEEYDCKDNQRRTLQSMLYSGQKATGSMVQAGPKPRPWRPVTAGTVGETMWKLACGKK